MLNCTQVRWEFSIAGLLCSLNVCTQARRLFISCLRCKMRGALYLLLYAPGDSNRFGYCPGLGFQHRDGAEPASFCLTAETNSGAHTYPANQSTFGSAVHPRLPSGD